MNHAFDVDIATEYGIEEAIMIQFLQFWIAKNKANEKHFHEGRTWTYNSASALLELFPYFKSEKKAQRLMRHLEEEGVIMSGNFNENPFDKTKWYAFCDESRFLKTDKKAQSDRSKKSAMKDKTDHSLLTVVDTVVDTFKNNTRQARNVKADDSPSFSPKDQLVEKGVDEQVANDWLQLRKSKKSAVTLTAINGIANEAKKAGVSLNQALVVCCQNGWSGFRADWIKPKTTNGSARLQGKALEDHNRDVSRKFLLSRGIDPDTGEELKNVADSEHGDDQKLIDFFGEGN